MKQLTSKRLSIALLACVITSPVMADVATQINTANALVREGKFDEALADYRKVKPIGELKNELDYNLAVAQYRKGDIESAKVMFTEASMSTDSRIAAAARYNLGNCFYADAVAAAEKSKPAAIASLHQAIDHYRGSLAGNSNNVDARANIELAGELLKQLQEEEEEQQQNEQNQEQQQQQNQQQNNQSQDSQDQDSSSQDQQQDQQNQDSQSKNGESQQDQDQDQEQSEESKDSQQQSQAQQEQSSQEEQGSSQEEKQQSGEEQSESGDPGNQVEMQPQDQQRSGREEQDLATPATAQEQQAEANDQAVPEGELKAASEQETTQQAKGSVAVADANSQDGLMSKEEALKMLQAVRDRDMLRRLRQQQIQRRMHVPTDKDW